MERLED